MRAKFVNADGGYQYRLIERLVPEMQFAIMPRITFSAYPGSPNTLVEVRRRRFEFWGRNENGVPVYREIVE